MLADYFMKSIDNLFSDKLFSNESINLGKNQPPKGLQNKANFNRETIKKSLHSIIRKDNEAERSPNCKKDNSPSQISKSRLKVILEHNKNERIKSVIKRSVNNREETSPYKKIQIDSNLMNRLKRGSEISLEPFNKENDIIRYYRQERKSTQKLRGLDKSIHKEGKKSRIFIKNSVLSHEASKSMIQVQKY